MNNLNFFLSVLPFLVVMLCNFIIAAPNISLTKVLINDGNFDEVIAAIQPDEDLLIYFTAKWCGACKPFKKEIAHFTQDYQQGLSDHSGLKIAEVDLESNPGLSSRFIVYRLPTVFHIKNGEFRSLEKHFTANELSEYFKKAEWSQIPPRAAFFNPTSPGAKILGHFGMIGKYVRDIREDYPPYMFYCFIILMALIPILLAFFLNRGEKAPKKGTKKKTGPHSAAAASENKKQD